MIPAVDLQKVTYSYAGTATGIAEVSLQIAPGELVAVIGPSGCGKSTLVKLIAGFLEPQAGRILIDGADAAGLSPARRELGIVFQNYALFPHMTARDNIAYPLRVRQLSRPDRLAAADEMLRRVGLVDKAGHRPPQLSGGQQQRVALARALVFKPRALLLDEPLSALDAGLRVGMRDEIGRLQREHAIATLYITHDQEEALSMADRVVVMRDGRVLQIGSPKDVYDHPVNAAVASFVGLTNLWRGRVLDAHTVDTAVGPICVTPGHRLAPSAETIVMVRPEAVIPGQAPDGLNQFAGRLARDRFLGSLRRYDFSTSRGVIAGETGKPGLFDTVHIPPGAIRLLPADASPTS